MGVGLFHTWYTSDCAAILGPLLCCTCFGSVAAASPVCFMQLTIISASLSLCVVEDCLLLLDCFTLPGNLIVLVQREIGIHLEMLRQGTIVDSNN